MMLDLYIPLWGAFLDPFKSIATALYGIWVLVLIVEVIQCMISFTR